MPQLSLQHKLFKILIFMSVLLCPMHHDIKEMNFEQEVISCSVKQIKADSSKFDLNAKTIKSLSLKESNLLNPLLRNSISTPSSLSLLATSSTVLLL